MSGGRDTGSSLLTGRCQEWTILIGRVKIGEIVSHQLRTRQVEECEIERVFEKAVNGMRNEMSIALWRI
jgi:hypothetical protein